jgi:hypothetical protein
VMRELPGAGVVGVFDDGEGFFGQALFGLFFFDCFFYFTHCFSPWDLWVKYGDDDGAPGVAVGDGEVDVPACDHVFGFDVSGHFDVVEVSGEGAHELDSGSVAFLVVVFEDCDFYHMSLVVFGVEGPGDDPVAAGGFLELLVVAVKALPAPIPVTDSAVSTGDEGSVHCGCRRRHGQVASGSQDDDLLMLSGDGAGLSREGVLLEPPDSGEVSVAVVLHEDTACPVLAGLPVADGELDGLYTDQVCEAGYVELVISGCGGDVGEHLDGGAE